MLVRMRKGTVAVLLAASLAGCGASKDKAEELIEVSGLTKHYSTIVEIASTGYASRYPMLEREQIPVCFQYRDNLILLNAVLCLKISKTMGVIIIFPCI